MSSNLKSQASISDKRVALPSEQKSLTIKKSVKSSPDLNTSISRLKIRKQSYGFSGVPGLKPIERTSQLGIEFKRPPLIFLNTYQLDPLTRFDPARVELTVNAALDEHFTNHVYNVQESPAVGLKIAAEVMRKCKKMKFNRYRIIAVATVGQKRAQSYNNAIGFLWDYERDSYVNVQRDSNTVFMQVSVFGVYLD